jgi:hypothetical protein
VTTAKGRTLARDDSARPLMLLRRLWKSVSTRLRNLSSRLKATEASPNSVRYQKASLGYLDLLVLLLFVLVFAAAASRLDFSTRWSYSDHLSLPFTGGAAWSDVFFAWNWRSLGHPGATGSLFQLAMVGLGLGTGLQGFDGLAQLASLPLAGTAFYLLLRIDNGPATSSVAAFFYSFNPLTVASFDGGDGGIGAGLLVLLVVFPIVYFGIFRLNQVCQSWSGRFLCLASIGVLLGLTGNDLPLLSWMFVPPILIQLIVEAVSAPDRARPHVFNGVMILVAAAPVLAISYLGLSSIANSPQSYTSFASSSALFVYSPATLLNLFKVAGSQGNSQWVLGYNGGAWWSLLGLAPGVIALCSLMVKAHSSWERQSLKISMGLTLCSGLALATAIRQGYLVWLMSSSAVFAALDDIVRVQFWILVAIVLLIPSGIRAVTLGILYLGAKPRPSSLHREQSREHVAIYPGLNRPRASALLGAVAGGLAVVIVFSNLPALDGTLGMTAVNGSSYLLPGEYATINVLINRGTINVADSRILWLPYVSQTSPRHYWLAQHEINAPYESTLFVSNGSQLITSLYNAICLANYTSDLSAVLEALSVRYIVLDFAEAALFGPDAGAASACSVQSSNVFVSIDISPGFLSYLPHRLANFSEVYADSRIEVLEDRQANALAYALPAHDVRGLGVSQDEVTSLSNGSNVIVGGQPPEAASWSQWPAASLFSIVDSVSGPVLRMNVSQGGLTVAAQTINVSTGFQYGISYDAATFQAAAGVRILWYNASASSLGDGGAMKVDYVQLRSGGLSGNVSLTPVETTLLPPLGAVLGKLELLVSDISPGDFVPGSYAEFGDIAIIPQHWVPNPDIVLPGQNSTCGYYTTIVNPSEIVVEVHGCMGDTILILNTAFAAAWSVALSGANTGGAVEAHTVANLFANAWDLNVSGNFSALLNFVPQAAQSILILGSIAYIASLPTALLVVYIFTRRRPSTYGAPHPTQTSQAVPLPPTAGGPPALAPAGEAGPDMSALMAQLDRVTCEIRKRGGLTRGPAAPAESPDQDSTPYS